MKFYSKRSRNSLIVFLGLGLEFYNIWARNRDIPLDFHCITYENLHRNTKETLTEVIQYFDWPAIDAQRIDSIVSTASFENMQNQEKDGSGGGGFRMRANDVLDPESY